MLSKNMAHAVKMPSMSIMETNGKNSHNMRNFNGLRVKKKIYQWSNNLSERLKAIAIRLLDLSTFRGIFLGDSFLIE